MRRPFALILLLLLAAPLLGQGPSADWRTIETRHFRVHYPSEYSEWATRAAARLESIRDAVAREVGFDPPQTIDVLVTNPIAQANGMALPLLDSPRVVFYAEPPGPDEQIGAYAHWIDLLAVHEIAHVVHMLRPSRNPLERLVERSVLPLNPITLRAPRWVLEGYATVVEGRLTGSGRPSSTMRALILRRFAQGGRLPTYEQLDSDQRFLGMSMAYLSGSAFLEWLEAQRGPESLRRMWARLTARHRRSFDEAFTGVFGEKPERMYGRFAAELTAGAMQVGRSVDLHEGEVFQQTADATGDLAASPDGSKLAVVIRRRNTPSKLVVWSTAAADKEEKKVREELEKILRRDPDDVAPVRSTPVEREPLHSLVMRDGGDIGTPRWSRDGTSLLFVHRMPDSEGFLHSDLFRWTPASGRVDRITRLADVRDADPLPDGTRAVAVRSRGGATALVQVDLASGEVTPLGADAPSVDVVFSSPRVSPRGEEIVYAIHRQGTWRLELRQLSSGTVRAIPTAASMNFSSPSWLGDDALVASVQSAGFVELATVSKDGVVTPRTRTAGGAFDATATADRIFFTSLDAEGFVVRALSRGGEAVSPWPAFGPELAPAVPPQPALAVPFEERVERPSHAYGAGRQELGWLVSQNVGPGQHAFEAGVRLGDVVGRLDTLLVGSFSNDRAQRGAALASSWRGWPIEVGMHLFSAKEKSGGGDLDREGVELRGRKEWVGATRRLAVQAGGFAGNPSGRAFAEARHESRQIRGSSRVSEEIAIWSDRGDGSHLRASATIEARLGGLRLRGTVRHDQLSRDGGTAEAISVGGLPSSILPVSATARRVLDPALPPDALRGKRYDGWRVESSVAGPLSIFYQRHDIDRDGLSLAGAELAMHLPPAPLLKTPALDLTAGGAKIFDGPMRGDTKYWVALTWRP